MYNGVDKTHPGYDATKSSLDYINYTACKADYTNAYNTMLSVVNDKMSNVLNSDMGFSFDGSNHVYNFEAAYDTFVNKDVGSLPPGEKWTNWLKVLAGLIGDINASNGGTSISDYASPEGKKWNFDS